jgi:hypothetical protein
LNVLTTGVCGARAGIFDGSSTIRREHLGGSQVMDKRDRAELRRIRKVEEQAGGTQHVHEQLDEALRATQPAIDARSDHDLAPVAATEKLRSLMVQVEEAYSEELRRMMAQFAPMIRAAANAQAESARRQLQDTLAAYEAQVAEMSRRIVKSLNIQMASALTARAEIFRETLDQVARIEIPYNPQPMPSPVGEMAAPGPQPSVPDRAERILDQIMAGLVVLAVWRAIVWYAQTGRWELEELLCYFLQVVQHLG